MSDRFGLLSFPATPPLVAPGPRKTRFVGDPALDQLGSFLAAVLQHDVGAAWEAILPGMPELPATVGENRTGRNVVRRVFPFDPRRGRPFSPDDLPALFLFRSTPAPAERLCADASRATSTVIVLWMPHRAAPEVMEEIEPFAHAIAASVTHAVHHGRHRGWVADVDRKDDDGLVTRRATVTAPVTLQGADFNGAMAAAPLARARYVTITTEPAAGAYSTDPFVVRGRNERGQAIFADVALTDADGGETVSTLFRFTGPTTIEVPEMALATGHYTIGYSDSPDARHGSHILTATQAVGLSLLRKGEWKPIQVPQGEGGDPLPFEGFEIALTLLEDTVTDPRLHADPIEGANAAFYTHDTLFATDTY